MQYTPLWTSILRSPKVFALDAEAFRFWVLCLAVAQEHDNLHGTLPSIDSLAFTLHMDSEDAREIASALVSARFLDESPAGFMIHDWKQWRRKTDPTAADRQRRRRERNCHDVTPVTPVTHVTNLNRDNRDTKAESVDQKPLRIVRRPMKPTAEATQSTHVNPNVTVVTGVTRDAECHAYITEHTEQNKLPLPPLGGGEMEGGSESGFSASPELEPFESEPIKAPGNSPPIEISAAAQAVMDRAAKVWGGGGLDWSIYLLGVFPLDVVVYGAKETLKWLNGRPYGKAASAYWERVCQNHRDGPPVEASHGGRSPGSRAAPAPKFSTPNPDLIYHPNARSRQGHENRIDLSRAGDGGNESAAG